MRSALFVIALLTACTSRPSASTPTTAPAPTAATGSQPMSDELRVALATFRAQHGKPWTPDAGPSIEASRIVFKELSLTGWTKAEVESVLGPPSSVEDRNGELRWTYVRHNGESGTIYVVRFAQDRVAVVDHQMTQ